MTLLSFCCEVARSCPTFKPFRYTANELSTLGVAPKGKFTTAKRAWLLKTAIFPVGLKSGVTTGAGVAGFTVVGDLPFETQPATASNKHKKTIRIQAVKTRAGIRSSGATLDVRALETFSVARRTL